MNIKIRAGDGVTELTEDKGKWNIKRNGAKIPIDKLEKIIKIMSEKRDDNE